MTYRAHIRDKIACRIALGFEIRQMCAFCSLAFWESVYTYCDYVRLWHVKNQKTNRKRKKKRSQQAAAAAVAAVQEKPSAEFFSEFTIIPIITFLSDFVRVSNLTDIISVGNFSFSLRESCYLNMPCCPIYWGIPMNRENVPIHHDGKIPTRNRKWLIWPIWLIWQK